MAGRWHDFGQYNAQAVTGANALSAGIEHMVTGLSSSPDSERGVAARLRYLTASAAGYAAIERAGINVTARTGLGSMPPTGTCAATTSPPTSNAASPQGAAPASRSTPSTRPPSHPATAATCRCGG